MNKEELIKLKEELIKNERYALIDQDMELSLVSKTKFEIESEIDNIGAIKTFEDLLEQYLKICIGECIQFDEFKVKIYPEYYVNINKIKNDKGFIDENNINKDTILNDVLNIRFAIYPYLNDKKITKDFGSEVLKNCIGNYHSFSEYCYNKCYIVNYSKFLKGLKELNYDVDENIKDFDSLINIDGLYSGELELTSIDFKEKTRKK